MPEGKPQTCSTRDALGDMLESASRRLNKALRLAGEEHANAPKDAVALAKAAVASLTTRLAAHRNLHHC
jgi:uncharacterized protein YecT (DUF1311 family)